MTKPRRPVTVLPLAEIGEVRPGDDLAKLLFAAIGTAGATLARDDVLVVTSKIVSKAEGRFVALDEVTPGTRAIELAHATRKDARLVELVLAESTMVVRAVPHVLITRHRLGLVMANAGIDQSNIGPGEGERALLLPIDPDASADRLRAGLADRLGRAPAIVISDSCGRAWRHGVVNLAIGASGLASLLDRRGERDRDGRLLEVTQVGLADIVASAAGLVTGEGDEGVPAAIVRGVVARQAESPAAALVRPPEQDLFL